MTGSEFIHKFIVGEDSPHPVTVVTLHGTGGDESDLLPLAKAVAPGASVLSPRGKILEHGAPRFFKRHSEGVFDYDDVRARALELGAFIRQAAERYGFASSRLFAVGYSNGANIASAMMLLDPDLFAGAILFRPMIPLDPIPDVRLGSLSVFMSAGAQDEIVPRAQVERLQQELTLRGAEVELRWQPGGHMIERPEVVQARDWMRRHTADPAG